MSPRFTLLLIFTLSGFSGLIYESIWTHYLKLLLGHAAYAQSLVLSIFLAGLGLGSWLSSRFLARIRNPLAAYVFAELFLAVCGLGFHGVFNGSSEIFYAFAASGSDPATVELVKWSLAIALITPQAIVLGMTFPWVSAALIRLVPDSTGYSVSMLYFTNSIGGAIGVLASGFVLINHVGLPGTLLTAALINVVIAIVVWPISKNPRLGIPVTDHAPRQPGSTTRPAYVLLSVAAFTGLASFYYEIAWIRMLSLVLSSSTHSFELMLSAFITGLALGGLWVRKRIDVVTDLVSYLGYIQLFMGLFAVLTLPFYILSFDIMSELIQVAPKNSAGYMVFTIVSHLICLAVMLPATFMAGMTLPLISKLMINGPYGERAVGYVYAFNMVGGIIGVLTAVHILIVTLGVKYLIVAGALVDIALGCWLLLPSRETKRGLAIVSVLGLIVVTVSIQRFSPEVLASGVYRYGKSSIADSAEVEYYKDGKTASVAVISDGDSLSIRTNGKPDAAVHRAPDKFHLDEPTMTLIGVLPLAMKPDATDIANIGFGAGITTHTLLGSSRLQRVDTIEIEPRMIEGARLFKEYNHRAYNDERSHIYIDDAKSFFARNNKQYDIIISEPSNPWVSGIANLFTDEFYHHVKPYIRDNGLFVQWLQLYEIDMPQVGSVIKALDNNFDYYQMFNSYDGDMIIIAADRPIPEPDDWVFREPGLKESLSQVKITRPYEFRIRKLGDQSTLGPAFLLTPSPMNSDYFPYLAFSAPKSMFLGVSASAYLSELRYADIPIWPIMNDLRLEELDPTIRAHHFHFYKQYRDADATIRLINEAAEPEMSQLSEAHIVNQAISMLRERNCPASLANKRTLYKLAKQMNPYLPTNRVAPFWSTLQDVCTGGDLSTWISLHKSITERDYDVMAATSRELITGGQYDEHDQLWHYLWTAHFLASHERRTWQSAVKFANEYDLQNNTSMAFVLSNIYLKLSAQSAGP